MLHPRIIPILLIHNKGLVKTVKFRDPKYVGDPMNAVKIFNEKEVDEIMVIDIDASTKGLEPDYKLVENLAYECRMPLCYGGGIKTSKHALQLLSLGVEKIAVSSVAVENPDIIFQIAERVGTQSVVVVLDVKKKRFSNKYDLYIKNGIKNTHVDPVKFAIEMERAGAGEIVINSIDNDGTMQGYNLDIIDEIRDKINIPLTVLGGAGSLSDIGIIIKKYGIIGAAAGSLFVFKGKYRAVLINYPTSSEKQIVIEKYFMPYWS